MKIATFTTDPVVVTEQLVEAPSKGLTAFVRRSQEFLKRRAIARELEGLSDGMLADIGIHRGEIHHIASQAARRGR